MIRLTFLILTWLAFGAAMYADEPRTLYEGPIRRTLDPIGPPADAVVSVKEYTVKGGKRIGLAEWSSPTPDERPQYAGRKWNVGDLRLHNGVYWRLRADGGWDYCEECNAGAVRSGVTTLSPMPAAPVYYAPYTPYSYSRSLGINVGFRSGGG